MARIKRNVLFVIGALVVMALIGFAGFQSFSGWKRNANEAAKRNRAGDERSNNSNPHPDSGNAKGPAAGDPVDSAKEITKVTILCRAVKLTSVAPNADTSLVYALENELKASPLLDPHETKLGPRINSDRDTNTFTFNVTLALKRPIKL